MERNLCCLLFLLGACSPGPGDSASSERGAIAAGIRAGADGLSAAQVRTFLVGTSGTWAAAYDPGDPPGCEPGGLAAVGPVPLPSSPCMAYVLERRKNRWAVVSRGVAGRLIVPDGAPAKLGDPEQLSYLGE